jgi:hypothetical protein
MVEKVGPLLSIWIAGKTESTPYVAAECTESMIQSYDFARSFEISKSGLQLQCNLLKHVS